MRHFVLAFALCSFGAVLAGCGGGHGGGGGGGTATSVAILNKQTSIPAGTQFVFNAQTSHNHGNAQGVTWALMPPNGEGTLSVPVNNGSSSSVTYTAPAVSCSNCVTITATSVENPSSTDSDTFSITGGSNISISTTSLPSGFVGIPYGSALQAVGGTPPYNWTVSGGSLPSGLSITTNTANVTGQTITAIGGTPSAAGTSQFTVQVTDSASPASSMTEPLTIMIGTPSTANNAELHGQYAFELGLFGQGAGFEHAIVGSFTADGNGNITAGVLDVNAPGGQGTLTLSGGSYAVGADHRGTAILNVSGGGSLVIAIALGSVNGSGVATEGRLIEFDYTGAPGGGTVGPGVMYLQDSSAFALSSVKGPYAFQFIGQGTSNGIPVVETGAATADGAGNFNPGEFDLNVNGTLTNTAFTAMLATDPVNTATSGRLTFSFVTGPSGNSVLYLVSASHALIMTTDPQATNGLLVGEALSQSSTSFSNSDLMGNAVFYILGQGQTLGESAATLGLVTFDGAGNLTLVSQDKNDSSTHTTKMNKTGLTYSVASNGRTMITGGNNPQIVYLVSSTSAFIMETTPSVGAGFVEEQTGGPFSAASVSGNYFFGVAPPAVPASVVASGIATSTGSATLNITADESSPLGLALDQAIAATGLNIAANGVGTDSVNDVIYMISPTKALLINLTPSAPEVLIIQQ